MTEAAHNHFWRKRRIIKGVEESSCTCGRWVYTWYKDGLPQDSVVLTNRDAADFIIDRLYNASQAAARNAAKSKEDHERDRKAMWENI